MHITRSIEGALAGSIEAVRGMRVTVDSYKHDDEDLAAFMDDHDDGYNQIISNLDNEGDLIWVEGCPYAIPSYIVYADRGIKKSPDGRETIV